MLLFIAVTTPLFTTTQIPTTASTTGAHISAAPIHPTTTASGSTGSTAPDGTTGGIGTGGRSTTMAGNYSGTTIAQGIFTKDPRGTTTNSSGSKSGSISSVSEVPLNTSSPHGKT